MSELGPKTLLAVDPGTSKCGLALVRRNELGDIVPLWLKVVPIEGLFEAVKEAESESAFSTVVVGSGTNSRPIVEHLRESFPSIGILIVEERDTTMQARERYWEHNPRRGWRKLLPATLQVPPESVDDFAALVLAERVLAI